jgi:hypothetical protein
MIHDANIASLLKSAQLEDFPAYRLHHYSGLSPAWFGALLGSGLGFASAPDAEHALSYALMGGALGGATGWGLSKAHRLANRMLRPFIDEEEPIYKPLLYGGGVGASLGALAALAAAVRDSQDPEHPNIPLGSILRSALLGGGLGALGGLGLRTLASI